MHSKSNHRHIIPAGLGTEYCWGRRNRTSRRRWSSRRLSSSSQSHPALHLRDSATAMKSPTLEHRWSSSSCSYNATGRTGTTIRIHLSTVLLYYTVSVACISCWLEMVKYIRFDSNRFAPLNRMDNYRFGYWIYRLPVISKLTQLTISIQLRYSTNEQIMNKEVFYYYKGLHVWRFRNVFIYLLN